MRTNVSGRSSPAHALRSGYPLAFLLIGAVCLTATAAPLHARDEGATAAVDSVRAQAGNEFGRPAWETVVSMPGKLIVLPVKVTFKAIKGTIAFVDERKLATRVADWFVADDRSRMLLPVASVTGKAGLMYIQRGFVTPGSNLTASAQLGPLRKQDYKIDFRRVQLSGGGLYGRVRLDYEFKPDEKFFGIGPRSEYEDETNFTRERAAMAVELDHGLFSRVALVTGADIELNNILGGRDTATPSLMESTEFSALHGVETGIRLGAVRVAMRYDSRDDVGRPMRGFEAEVSGVFRHQIDGDTYGYWRGGIDVRRWIHLFYRRSLQVRFAGQMTQRISHRRVPFFALSELGEHETIRGFSRGRFRDMHHVIAGLEYRYPIRSATDFLLFVDTGQVFNDDDWFDVGDTRVGVGAGIHVFDEEFVRARLEAGFSKDEWRIYFSLN